MAGIVDRAAASSGPPPGAQVLPITDEGVIDPNIRGYQHASADERMGDLVAARQALERGQDPWEEDRIPASLARGDWGQGDRGIDAVMAQHYSASQPRNPQGQFAGPPQPMVAHGNAGAVQTPGPIVNAGPQPPQMGPQGPITYDPRAAFQTRAPEGPQMGQASPWGTPPAQQPWQPIGQQAPPGVPQMPPQPQHAYGQPRTPDEARLQQALFKRDQEIGELRTMMTETLRTMQTQAQAPPPMTQEQKQQQFEQEMFGTVAKDSTDYEQPLSRAEMLHAFARMTVDNQQLLNNAVQQSETAAMKAQMGIDPAVEQAALRDRPYIAAIPEGPERLQAVADWKAAQGQAPNGANGANGQATLPPGWEYRYDQAGQLIAVPAASGTAAQPGAPGMPNAFPTPQGRPLIQRAHTFVERGNPMFEMAAPQTSPALQNIQAKKAAGQHVSTQEYAAALAERGVMVGQYAPPS